jgi:hypothetical protein
MRRTALVVVLSAAVLSVCVCCVAGMVWWNGYYLPYKSCRPVAYPNGSVVTQDTRSTVSEPIDVVIKYYDQRLSVRSNSAEFGQWTKEILPESRILYSCAAVDINRLSTETGCIYIQSVGGSTEIQTKLLRGEGGEWPCPK